jgi:hypothetical protein
LRYEAFRAGMQDYELLRMLKQAADKPRTPAIGAQARRLLKTVHGPLAGSLTEFTRDGKRLALARLEIGRCIAANG